MGVIKNKIFVLHGWAYSTDKWKNFIDLLVEEGFNVEMPKIPGLTQSITKPWSINSYVEWLKQLAEKEKDKIVLVGHSNGGRIALWFANKYPAKIKQLVLIDSAGIYRNNLPILLKRRVFKAIAKIGKKLASSKLLEKILYKVAQESDYKDGSATMKQTMLNLLKSDQLLSLKNTTVSTLIIWGRNDTITPLHDGQVMHGLIKNSKLKIIENAKHSPQFTHPKEVASIIASNLTM